jgi:hypothetical protein
VGALPLPAIREVHESLEEKICQPIRLPTVAEPTFPLFAKLASTEGPTLSGWFSMSCNLERLTQRLKFFNLPTFQFRPDLLKLPHSLYRIEPLATAEANLGLYLEDRCIITSPKELLDLLLDELPTTDRTTTERDHF